MALAAVPTEGAMGRTGRRRWVGLGRAGGVDLGWVEVELLNVKSEPQRLIRVLPRGLTLFTCFGDRLNV